MCVGLYFFQLRHDYFRFSCFVLQVTKICGLVFVFL